MKAAELVIVARIADHIEGVNSEYDALQIAERLFSQFKRSAPELWQRLESSEMSTRQIGDWIYKFLNKHAESGQSLKNFAADAADRGEPKGAPPNAGEVASSPFKPPSVPTTQALRDAVRGWNPRQYIWFVLSSRRVNATAVNASIGKDVAAREARNVGGIVKGGYMVNGEAVPWDHAKNGTPPWF